MNVDEFTEQVRKLFGLRVKSLLFFGSSAFGRGISFDSDYDFTLVLDSRESGDLEKFAQIGKSYTTDAWVHYLDELALKGFQQGSHGVYFCKYLANSSQVLLGENIFVAQEKSLQDEDVHRALVQKIDDYFQRIAHVYFSGDTNGRSLYTKKYLHKILLDILLLEGVLGWDEVTVINPEELYLERVCSSGILLKDTKSLIKNLTSLDDKDIQNLFFSMRMDYSIFLRKMG